MLNSVKITGFEGNFFMNLDCSFLKTGISYSTFIDPKDFDGPTGIYLVAATGSFHAEWDGQKFEITPAAREVTHEYYKNWRETSCYGTWQKPYTGGAPEIWDWPLSGKVEAVILPYYTGSFTEDITFCGNVSYWREDRFKPPISGYDNGLPTIKWEAPQDE